MIEQAIVVVAVLSLVFAIAAVLVVVLEGYLQAYCLAGGPEDDVSPCWRASANLKSTVNVWRPGASSSSG